jgi:RHS repeat-associated protein
VVATASLSLSATKPTATFEFDEFGNPKQVGALRFGWLGGKQRRTELPSGVVQMGARSYVPSLGRFLTLDPIQGGSANAYDYANQDPVNQLDLNGECPKIRPSAPCGKGGRAASPRELKRIARREARASRVPVAVVRTRACTAIACTVRYGGGGGRDPIGDFLGKVANKVVNYLIDHTGAEQADVRNFVNGVINGVKGPAGRRAIACADGATTGWVESASIRGSFPVGGLAASAAYTATHCAIGAVGD